jgi:hypothetical protein
MGPLEPLEAFLFIFVNVCLFSLEEKLSFATCLM